MSEHHDAMPTDARLVLCQLFAATATAIEAGDIETARATLDSARTVATNKLPAGEDRALLLDGCRRVVDALDDDATVLAIEYAERLQAHIE